jgi:hypothetical protein
MRVYLPRSDCSMEILGFEPLQRVGDAAVDKRCNGRLRGGSEKLGSVISGE